MTRPATRSRRVLAALLLPLALLLAACDIKATTEFRADDTIIRSMEFTVERTLAAAMGLEDCESLRSMVPEDEGPDDVDLHDRSDEQNLTCRGVAKEPSPLSEASIDGLTVEHADGTFVVTSTGEAASQLKDYEDALGTDAFTYEFVFPGEVTSVEGLATDAYTVDANSVSITAMSELTDGFTITAYDDPAAGSGISPLWIALGTLTALLIAAAIIWALRGRRGASA